MLGLFDTFSLNLTSYNLKEVGLNTNLKSVLLYKIYFAICKI